MRKVERRLAGREARRMGVITEETVNIALRWYEARHLAKVDKTPELFKVTSVNRHSGLMTGYISPSQPDYKGVLKGGRCVCFELKSGSSGRIEASRVQRHQLEYLLEMAAMGADTFVLITFDGYAFYKLTAEEWNDFERLFGKKSVTEKDVAGFKVPVKGGIPLILDKRDGREVL